MIVCVASGSLGIGKNGTMPWPFIKKDMYHFRDVTTSSKDLSKKNAVVMGRQTYMSLPERNRYVMGINTTQYVKLFYL